MAWNDNLDQWSPDGEHKRITLNQLKSVIDKAIRPWAPPDHSGVVTFGIGRDTIDATDEEIGVFELVENVKINFL